MIVMQTGGGMPFGLGGPFQGPGRPMPFGEVGFPGPPSPGEMSAVGTIATAAETAERVQREGSPRSPSVVSAEGTEKNEQSTFETQMQREQDDRQQQAAGALLFRGFLHKVYSERLSDPADHVRDCMSCDPKRIQSCRTPGYVRSTLEQCACKRDILLLQAKICSIV